MREADLVRQFARVVDEPATAEALVTAARVMAALEKRAHPARAEIAIVTRHALIWWSLGFGARAQVLLARWRKAGHDERELRLAEAHFALRLARAAATGRLRAVAAGRDAQAVALELVDRFFAADLRGAVELARAHGWFLSHPEAATCFMHLGWALAMLGRFEEAEGVLVRWKRRFGARPEIYQMVRRAEAIVAEYRWQYPRELAALQEADALCAEHGLGIARASIEVTLPTALGHNDDWDAAHAILARWPEVRGDYVRPIDAGRDFTRADLALLRGHHTAAEAIARRTLRAFLANGNAVFTCLARYVVAMAAPATRFARALDDYRVAAHRHQIPEHLARVRLLDALAAAGCRAARDVTLVERTRFGRAQVPLVRLFTPRLGAIAADLYWDRVQGALYLSGGGPFSLVEHPILRRVVETVLARADFRLPLAALFEAVWEQPWDPLAHEGKLHVTLHRLRRWLDEHRAGAGALLEVRDGVVGLADGHEVCVVEAERLALPAADERLAARLLRCLTAEPAPLPPRELERRLGVSRSALTLALRTLVAAGRIRRTGEGRALRYSVAAPG